MSKGDTFENDLLKLLFQGTAISNLAQNGSSPVTSLYVSLHTADPGEAGAQNTSEVAYTGYARVAVLRSAAGWVIVGNVVNPVAPITFPACSAAPAVATHWAVGMASSGASMVLYSGPISPSLAIGIGLTPELSTTTNITED